MTTTKMTVEDIQTRLAALREENPKMRAKDIADALDISEGELLAAQVGEAIIRLKDEPVEILKAVEELGEVMALSRNKNCVHERKGVYEGLQVFGKGAAQHVLMVNPDGIDLRIFISQWTSVFAVLQKGDEGPRSSLQFFDKAGVAIHKIYLTELSNADAFMPLVARFMADDQTPGLTVGAYDAPAKLKSDEEVNWEKFRSEWEKMQDVHEFFPMLRKFKIHRLQGHRHIGHDFAMPTATDAARKVIDLAASKEFEIMVFVGNKGIVQIHTGQLTTVKEFGTWYNVLDPKFNLHLDETGIAECWVTRKPTKDGLISSLEVFDKDGELIVTFFGRRTEGEPEQEAWRDILAELPLKETQNAA